ncbi:MAG: sugar-binding protein [Micrococcales bacterium]|nr:sugar-binding protein [Micrococcales bacterium]
MSLKKITAVTAGLTLAMAALVACGNSDDTGGGGGGGEALIGITMPDRALERWNRDGSKLQEELEAMGYKTDLQYAENSPETQVSQLENQINAGAKVLVVASIDSEALGPILATAADKGITIIAYDRLLMKTPNVDYYATFDNAGVGQLQGEFLRDALDLDNRTDPVNFESFAGSDDDNNAGLFFGGAWDVLQPYFDEGKLVCQSGKCPATKDKWMDVSIHGWVSADAQTEMQTRLNSFYTDKKVEAILSPNDSLAFGIAAALDGAGYQPGVDWPLLTGQDGDEANVKNIIAGKQSMTVFKDTRLLATAVAKMVDQIVKGDSVETNTTYNNDVQEVPTMQLDPQVVTEDTVQAIMVDSGFFTPEQLGL